MRTWMAVIGAALMVGACSSDTTGPSNDTSQLADMADYAFGAMRVGDPGNRFMERLAGLPADLALTAAQRTQIDALNAQFLAATAADRAALAALAQQAAAARQAGQTREQVQAILAGGAAIRTRLQQAELALYNAILGVLTPAQLAWLSGRTPREPGPCSTVTEAQRNEISALRAAFEQANAADIAAVAAALDRARAAGQAGATREQIAAILAEARAAMQRLATARAALHAAVNAVLTPEQVAAGCLGGGSPGTRTRP